MQTPAGSSRNRNTSTTPRHGAQWSHSNIDGDPTASALVQSTLLRYQQQSQHSSRKREMEVQMNAKIVGQVGTGAQEEMASASPARQRQQSQRRRLSVDESMAAAGLFVLAQVTGDDAGSRGTNKTGIAPASSSAQPPPHVPTRLNVDKAAAQSSSTRNGRRLPRRESGKINDGLQPQILTRDAIVQHQYQGQHHLDSISKAHSAHAGKLQSSLSMSLPGTKTPLAVGIGKSIAPAVLYQQPHRPDLYNSFLFRSAQRASVTKANEISQLHTNQQLLSFLHKRRIEEMLRNSSTIGTAAGTVSPYTSLRSQLQIHPPAKRVKIKPPVASVPFATSAPPVQHSASLKKRILARNAHIDSKHVSLAPEEEVDPLSGNLIKTVQDYYPHEDESAKSGKDRDCTTNLRARAFMSSYLGRTAVPQSGYGNLTSWRSAKRNLRNPVAEASSLSAGILAQTAQGRVASEALTRILPSSPSITDSTSYINKTRGKISTLM